MNAIPCFRKLRRCLPLLLCPFIAAACAPKAQPPTRAVKASMQYSAAARTDGSGMPGMVYFFPPLLCDASGQPRETLAPVEDPERGIVDWVTPSAKSHKLRRQLEDYFRSRGDRVVSFEDVLAAEKPHSILIVSTFYSAPVGVENPKPGQADEYVLSKMKASTFDVDLDPAKSRDVARIEGVTFFDSNRKPADIEVRSFDAAIRSLGENVSAVASLEP